MARVDEGLVIVSLSNLSLPGSGPFWPRENDIIGLLMLTTSSLDLCCRRQWPEPVFTPFRTPAGFVCVARVNNREYQSDALHESDRLARENAAMRAYLICQNFSKSDGMYPTDRKRGNTVQGRPIAIGTERSSTSSDDSRSSGSRSGGSSPTSYGSFQSDGVGPRTGMRNGSSRHPRRRDARY